MNTKTLSSSARSQGCIPLSSCFLTTGCLAALFFSETVHAQVNLNSAISLNMGTGVYTYSYSVMNNGDLELALVDVEAAAESDLMNLIAPTRFAIALRSGGGPGVVF